VDKRQSHGGRALRRRAADANWAFHATDSTILRALATGQHRENLREYFGTAAYNELSILAATAKGAKICSGPQVLILPGIMGSRLETAGDVLWIDPLRIAAGRLKELILPSTRSIRPMGVLLFSYAKLKLKLDIAGFDARFIPYDWRLGIDELGANLAARIAAAGNPVVLIAHSMGGLIARIAAKQLPKRLVRRLIMLGAPNGGSFAPVQALRGTYPFVRKMSRFDRRHSAEYLAEEVFCTFPGIYHMLPPRQHRTGVDLLDPRCWPKAGPMPDAALLGQVEGVRERMAAPDRRMVHIVGVNRETVVEVRRTASGFEYGSSMNGDGTVPVALAMLPKLSTYFVDEWHGNLANNSRVIRAIIELLLRGSTRQLARRFVPKRARLSRIDDARLRLIGGGKIDWRLLDSAQREAALAEWDGGRLA
jgi:pimeloyl-ACP methyl ester carboxylesterase